MLAVFVHTLVAQTLPAFVTERALCALEDRGIRVPKRDLASAPLVLMQNKQLKIA